MCITTSMHHKFTILFCSSRTRQEEFTCVAMCYMIPGPLRISLVPIDPTRLCFHRHHRTCSSTCQQRQAHLKYAPSFFQIGIKSSNNNTQDCWVANGDNPLTNHTTSVLKIIDNGNIINLNQATKFHYISIQYRPKMDYITEFSVRIKDLILDVGLVLKNS